MILSKLCEYYDVLAQDSDSGISQSGYSAVGCSAVIVLTKKGDYKKIVSLINDDKKLTTLIVPKQNGRSGKSPQSYFLCDNAKYFLGFEYDKKEKKLVSTIERLKSAYEYHTQLARESNDEALLAVSTFLKKLLEGNTLGISDDDPIFKKGNIVFRFDTGEYIHDIQSVKLFWEKKNQNCNSDVLGQCLITGEENQPIARIHTMLKGVYGANPTGCSLVGFNLPSFTSYGKDQSFNAPVSEKAMFKYTTALNYLLQNQNSKIRMGDSTVVFWAMTNGKEQNVMSYLLSGYLSNSPTIDTNAEKEMLDLIKNVRSGKTVISIENPNTETFVLGLAPNMARVSVRLWYQSTFKEFIDKISRFQDEAEIIKSEKLSKFISIPQILRTISPKSKTWWDTVPATYEYALFKSIVSGSSYPMAIYTAILTRIHAEAGDDYGIDATRTGFIKAVLMRNYHNEELTVSLNQNSTNTAYNLGRLFAVMEALQSKANGMTNIRERYFGSASVNPKLVFPSLLNLAQHHIAKLGDKGFYQDKQMEGILSKIDTFPVNLSLEEQGEFVLGYYHQREYIYTKKVETKEE